MILFSGCVTAPGGSGINPYSQVNTTVRWTDSINETHTLEHPAERIVSLDPYTVEILILLGAGSKILGITDTVNKTEYSGSLPNARVIGTSSSPDFESIWSLHPDVVILQKSWSLDNPSTRFKQRFTMLNLTDTYFSTYGSRMTASVREIGKMIGESDNATRYLDFYQSIEDLIDSRLANITPEQVPSVFYETRGKYSIAGPGSGGSYHLKGLKVINIGDNLTPGTPTVSPEWIISQNPDVIIKIRTDVSDMDSLSGDYQEMVSREILHNVSAIVNKRVYVFDTDIMYGPKEIIGRLYLAKAIYPDMFRDIDPDQVLKQYAVEFIPGYHYSKMVYPPFLPMTNSTTPENISNRYHPIQE